MAARRRESSTAPIGALVVKAKSVAAEVRMAEARRDEHIAHLDKIQQDITSALKKVQQLKENYTVLQKEAVLEGYDVDFSDKLQMIEQVNAIYVNLLETTTEMTK